MRPVIDRDKTLVAWLLDSVQVYSADGTPVGSVQVGEGMYSLDGDFLGYLRKGVFRGKDGLIVAYLGTPSEPPGQMTLLPFELRTAASTWPPTVAFQQEWSSAWRFVFPSASS